MYQKRKRKKKSKKRMRRVKSNITSKDTRIATMVKYKNGHIPISILDFLSNRKT